ncbi:MAG: response regulator [Verrucomicrobiota bacterium]
MNTEARYGAYEAAVDRSPVRTVVVDDSPMMLKTLSLLLEREKGLQLVGTATDGRHAVRRAIELEPDLVLMDLRLPGMNGFEATRRIKARSPAPAVIMVTADDTPECRAAASAAGTDGFVGKQQMFTQLAPAIRKLFPKAASAGLVLCCVLAAARAAWAEQTPAPADTAPVQAIQQAPDPSAAVTAYANGIALDRNDPKLYEAYVARMVDFGLPELAYHQARMLTTLQSSNGLAWGVVAYVDARRGQMADAILAVNLAGQFAPENKFVAHTAGELLAWYDLKADKTTLPENARQGLAKIRALLGKQAAFTGAYDTACKAYQAQANAEVQPAQAAPGQYAPAPQASGAPPLPATPAAPPPPQVPLEGDLVAPLGYAAPAAPPAYYPDYSDASYGWAPDFCDNWGPGWIAPAPWSWWQPCGFWGGCGFFPFGAICLFGDFDHGGRFGHGDHWGRNGAFGPGRDPGVWHHGVHGRDSFFGTPARPSGSVAQWAHEGSRGPAALTTADTGSHWRSGAGERGSSSSTRPSWAGRTDYNFSYVAPRAASPVAGAFGSYRTTPAYRAQVYAAPHWAAPGGSSFGGYRQAPYSGGFHGAGSSASLGGYRGGYHGGGSRAGSSSGGFHGGGHSFGGGFHGGGFGGGGHGGGGHR